MLPEAIAELSLVVLLSLAINPWDERMIRRVELSLRKCGSAKRNERNASRKSDGAGATRFVPDAGSSAEYIGAICRKNDDSIDIHSAQKSSEKLAVRKSRFWPRV